ncbi:uncharacterized protein NPIL_270551, partial [Nephila pilipes]
MNFLRQEVKSEEMANLARTFFASHQNPRRKEFQNEQLKQSEESSTASALVSLQKPGKKDCIFCDKSHPSEKCYLAKKMTLTAKQKLLLEKGACVSCLKIAGHITFSEKAICGFIPRIENDEILNELKRKKIVFADFFREETDINLLIGADVLGILLTGNTVVLECGLTAVETKLGWTVFGKGSCRIDNILPSLSMHSMSLPANKLWELEVLGIASENEKEKDDFNLKDFYKIKILPEGRYE